MPSADRRDLGAFGESAALAYLIRNGYRLIARNWRCSHGEIDLIAQHGDQVVFVEVRTRRNGVPEESLGPAKRSRLIELAYAYCSEQQLPESQLWRIDMIAVVVDRGGKITRLAHLEYAVEQ